MEENKDTAAKGAEEEKEVSTDGGKKNIAILKLVLPVVALIVVLGVVIGYVKASNRAYERAAKAVDQQIMEIGEVSRTSQKAIEAAEQAYDNLDEADQKRVKKHKNLEKARKEYSQLGANEVIATIDKIGEVTISSQAVIATAQSAFDKLSEDEKALVTNKDVLEQAATEYDRICVEDVEGKIEEALKDRSKIATAESSYQKLTQDQKTQVKNYDLFISSKISWVVTSIDSLGEITLESEMEIKTVEQAYNSLSAEEKKQVTNKSVLTEAREKLDVLIEENKVQTLETSLLEQPMYVVSTKYVVQHARYKALYPDMLQAVIKNASGTDVKDVVVAFVAWDANGFPVKIIGQYDFDGGSYVKHCNFGDVNMVDGATYGSNGGMEIDDDTDEISTIKAIVVSYKDFDGNTWNNPYYDTWREIYENKKLPK